MDTAAIIIGITFLSIAAIVSRYFVVRARRVAEAERVLESFFDFNREVTKQLLALEDQGRNCYQSLDGDAMRLIYEAQKAVNHGRKLEKLGIDALAARDSELLSEVREYFDLDTTLGSIERKHIIAVDELTPRAYKLYAVSLIQKINKKVQAGLENRKRLQNMAVAA